jgi:hypothetical protein
MIENRKAPGITILAGVLFTLSCAIFRQIPQPVSGEVPQLAFEIQTATPTISALFDVPTATIDPNATATTTPTLTPTVTATAVVTTTAENQPEEPGTPIPATSASQTGNDNSPVPTPPPPTPTVVPAEPLRGGEWDFEAGFAPWTNPFGDSCDGAGLAIGWQAFTTRDQYGSSCMNQTTWSTNVYSGESAQEITFAYVGNQAGIYKTAETTPGHRYTVEAFAKREFSPAAVELQLGFDGTGGGNWESDSVEWLPWDEDIDDEWARTEGVVTATGNSMTLFIKGSHPFPEPGGVVRIDNITITDQGPE